MLVPLTPEERLALLKQALERVGFLPPETDIAQIRGFWNVFRTNSHMQYQPSDVAPVPVSLFAADDQEKTAGKNWQMAGPSLDL